MSSDLSKDWWDFVNISLTVDQLIHQILNRLRRVFTVYFFELTVSRLKNRNHIFVSDTISVTIWKYHLISITNIKLLVAYRGLIHTLIDSRMLDLFSLPAFFDFSEFSEEFFCPFYDESYAAIMKFFRLYVLLSPQFEPWVF